jgi:hypothetical protein
MLAVTAVPLFLQAPWCCLISVAGSILAGSSDLSMSAACAPARVGVLTHTAVGVCQSVASAKPGICARGGKQAGWVHDMHCVLLPCRPLRSTWPLCCRRLAAQVKQQHHQCPRQSPKAAALGAAAAGVGPREGVGALAGGAVAAGAALVGMIR